ncbi:MAG TPA: DUF6600 domain-containing protein [Verrucomicrobiae bacterium]|jgi:hypothetical protein|nr:DUF6600 domain-containing protein [Verrucomicrobiae bacterium]
MKLFFIYFAAISLACLGTGITCEAQTAPADLSPDVQEVLTLSRQHMDDSVITNYISSTGKSYKLSADDILYLNKQGVSQAVISALLATGNNANNQAAAPTAPAAPAPAASPAPAAGSSPTPPPVDAGGGGPTPPSDQSTPPPAASVAPATPAPISVPPMMAAPLLDNFYGDAGLNPAIWQTQSPLLSSLGAMYGPRVTPTLGFSSSGMEMSGINNHKRFMGIQSVTPYTAPFTLSATVTGNSQNAIPFEIYLVSSDLQQWLNVAGHLGGRGTPRGEVHIGLFGPLGGAHFGVPTGGGQTPDYGVWLNHTGSGFPISSLGNKLYPYPVAGVPYTIQVSIGGDGLAAVTLLDANRGTVATESVPAGTGPFYVVLAGRDGSASAEWQAVQLTPTTPAPASAPAAMEAPAAPPTPTLAYYQQQLAPYGTWVTVPGYGVCWEPAVSPGWRPYYDGGHWEYTDAGYFWQSDYPWGDIAFHYGRWAYVDLGADPCWVWVPGFEYAPAWVVWRHDDDDGYIGWAPLPPGATFVDGAWLYRGARVDASFDFGLGAGFFTFVAYDHFWEHNYRLWVVPHDRMYFAYHHSLVESHYRYDHGVFINVGLAHDRMVVYTHHDFHPTPWGDVRHQEEMHHEWERNNDIHDYHPGGHPDAWGHGGGGYGGGHDGHDGHGGWH